MPFVVENDARAAALGERKSDAETLVYVKVATGIGCGIVVEGSILRGAHGAAGDIGHIRINDTRAALPLRPPWLPRGLQLRTGHHRTARRAGHDRVWMPFRAAAFDRQPRGDPPCSTTAADVLGRALAATVTTINPDRLVLGGKIGAIHRLVDRVKTKESWPTSPTGSQTRGR